MKKADGSVMTDLELLAAIQEAKANRPPSAPAAHVHPTLASAFLEPLKRRQRRHSKRTPSPDADRRRKVRRQIARRSRARNRGA